MEIKKTKNEYGWFSVHCPFCIYKTRESGGDKMRWLKQHILKMARIEAVEWVLEDANLGAALGKQTPHLTYVKAHTNNEKVIKVAQRVFDDDMKLEK